MNPALPQRPEVFRPRRPLAVVMGLAGLLWLVVLVYLLQFNGVPLKTLLSAVFFVAFFAASVTYYGRTFIEVDGLGLTYRGMVRTRRLGFDEIRKVEVLTGPVIVYSVRSSNRRVNFTSFFSEHRRLAELVVERAGLLPLRA
jgi:hypothetical protein